MVVATSECRLQTKRCPYCAGHGYVPTEDYRAETCPVCLGETTVTVRLPLVVRPRSAGDAYAMCEAEGPEAA